jgi:hypothetical protein
MLRQILNLLCRSRAGQLRGAGAAPSRWPRRWVPEIEALESRYTPNGCSVIDGSAFRLDCTGPTSNTIVLDYDPPAIGFIGGLNVTVNGVWLGDFGEAMNSIVVNVGNGGDYVMVLATPSKPLTIQNPDSFSASHTKVYLGKDDPLDSTTGYLGGIKGPVTIKNSPSIFQHYAELYIDNRESTVRHDVTLEKTAPIDGNPAYHLIGLGSALAPISWVENDVSALTIWGSTVATGTGNVYTVANTPQNSALVTTTLYSGAGAAADTVHVQQTTGALVIDGQNGQDKVDVGSATDGLNGIQGKVTVKNKDNWSDLTVNDTGDTFGRYWELNDKELTSWWDSSKKAVIAWGPNDLNSLTINGSNSINQFWVKDTPQSAPPLPLVTTINTGGSGTSVHVVKTSGNLILKGVPGTNLYGPDGGPTSWNITDNDIGTITGPNLNGWAPKAVEFNHIGWLFGGNGTNVFSFKDGKGVSGMIDGGGGPHNTLDYSQYTTGVYVNLQLARATNVNGGSNWSVSNIQDVFGGNGDDILAGNGQGNTLWGGPGGRDLIIAGWNGALGIQSNTLIASPSTGCILISGYTDYDTDDAALQAILKEWVRPISYADRVDHIRNGGADALNKDASGNPYLLNFSAVVQTVHYNLFENYSNTLIGSDEDPNHLDPLDLYFGKFAQDSRPTYKAAETWVEIT